MSSISTTYQMLSLSDVGVSLFDCEHSTPKPALDGFPYIAIPNIVDGRIDLTDVRLISEDDLRYWTRKTKPQAGDIILTRRGRVGDTGLVPNGLRCAIGQNLVILRSDGQHLRQDYLRWVLRGPLYQQQVKKYLNVGAVFDSLNCADIPKFEIPVPTLSEQRAIANILGALDDKIELNHQMNATLEAMAQAIFKSWFVDFDPVRAKAAGRQPLGMDAATAALFPDGFEESELGRIPRGWIVSTIGEEVSVVGGSTPSTEESIYWEGGAINWATPKDMSSLTTHVLLDTQRKITEQGLSRISSGLLPSRTVLLSSRAPIGYLAVSAIPVAINQGIIAMVCDSRLTNQYILHWTQNRMEEIKSRANGTTFLEVSKASFRPLRVLVPSLEVLSQFNAHTESLATRIKVNLNENRTLTDVRDTLLPKLLSGEVRVS